MSSPVSSSNGWGTCPILSWPSNSMRSSCVPCVRRWHLFIYVFIYARLVSNNVRCNNITYKKAKAKKLGFVFVCLKTLPPSGITRIRISSRFVLSTRAEDKILILHLFPPGLQDKKEKVRGVYSIIDQLSRTHLNTLERLIFHLVRYQENSPPLGPNRPPSDEDVGVSNFLGPILCLGLRCRRTPTACRPTPWPSCSPPASCAVPTPPTHWKASRTLARRQREKA